MTRLLLRTLPFVLAVALLPRVARADDTAKCGEAEVIFREGFKKREAKEYAAALLLFKQSLALCRSPGLGALYNIAIVEDDLGRIAASYLHYAEFHRDVGVIDERRDDAKKVMTRMWAEGTRLRFLNLDKLPTHTFVSVDDAVLGNSTDAYEIPAEPGDHVVLIRERGQTERRLSVRVVQGDKREVDVKPIVSDPPPTTLPSTRIPGFIVGGIGIAGLVTGAILRSDAVATYKALDKQYCPDHGDCLGVPAADVDRGENMERASTATFLIGGALTALGATLILLPPTKSKEIALAPLVLPGGGGLSFSTRF